MLLYNIKLIYYIHVPYDIIFLYDDIYGHSLFSFESNVSHTKTVIFDAL